MRRVLPFIFLSLMLAHASHAQQPVITSLAPAQGHPGDNVLITGSGFDATASNNIVHFGATRATVVSAGTTTLSVTVPVGATHMPVSVTNNASALTGFSSSLFLPTYDNSAYDPSVINFEPKVDIANGVATIPYAVTIADLDNDGKPDMVVANSGAASITVYRNIGSSGSITTGSFDAGVTYALSQVAYGIATSDLDGDGKLDIIVTNAGSVLSYVSIFRNTISAPGGFGPGSFAARVDMSTNANVRGVAVGDMDVDGKPDIAVACISNVVNLFRNASVVGAINFDPKENIVAGNTPVALAIAEIDGDNKPELLVVNTVGSNVSVFRNISTPGILVPTSFSTITNFVVLNTPNSIAVVDVDGDGKRDVCIANTNSNNVSIFRNISTTGTINSGSLAPRVEYSTGNSPMEVTLSDINGDGKPELLTSNNSDLNISVFRNTGTAGVIDAATFAARTDIATASGVHGLAAGDMDGDGLPDLVCTGKLLGTVTLHRNNPMGHITGTTTVCISATTTLNITTTGGTWSSADATATVNATTGVVTGVSAGTATISYTVGANSVTTVVTVSPTPTVAAITGTSAVCAGATVTLSNATPGGTWSSTIAAAGTIDASGVVTGIAAGTTTISYLVATACGTVVATQDVTVNPLPAGGAIFATAPFCSGTNITLSASITGGTWSTTDVAVATVDGSTGEVTGVSGGTATMSYTTTNACGNTVTTTIVTVNAAPTTITGTMEVCTGSTTTLSTSPIGGVWSSGNTGLATVNSSGVVTGVAAGVLTISYTRLGCSTSTVVTVHQTPNAGTISGAAVFCVTTNITLASTAPGGSWSSMNTAVATIGTDGVVSGVGAGTALISYTMSNICATVAATTVVTVEIAADPGTISGPSSVCASGSTINLSNSVTGGTWSSSNTLAGTISSGGVVTGIDPGTTTISYTVGNSCGPQHTTQIVTVNPLPNAITGTAAICKNATSVLSSSTPGGSWSSSSANVTVDGTGMITGVNVGTARISYTLVVGCLRTQVVTVHALPTNITGTFAVCVGGTTTLNNSIAGGTWTSGNTAVGTIGSTTGIVTAISAGTTTITYTRPVTGCYTTATVTVNALPSAIAGDLVLCAGKMDTFSCAPPGGTWLSNNYGVAAVSAGTGIVTGISAGTARITYMTPATCVSFVTVTINQSPGNISGSLAVCEGSTSMLTNSVPYGVWVSSNTAVGVVSTSGVVAGIAPGTANVSYVLGNGCSKNVVVTINPLPTGISGPSTVCTGKTISLSGSPVTIGTSWSSSNAFIATVGSTGVVTGVNSGTVAISYSLPTGCKIPKVITVNPTPSAIAGTRQACMGATTLLGSSPLTGSWSSSNTAIATVGSAAGLVTGVAVGTATISYQIFVTGCLTTAVVTVDPLPSGMEGPDDMCVGSTTTFIALPTGGTWTSSAPGVATAGILTGIVTGVSAGTSRISYKTAAGCVGYQVLTVNATPSAGIILGTPTLCEGATVSLMSTVPGGTWTTVTGKTSITSAGVVTGISSGVDTVKYTANNGCGTAVTNFIVTVNPLPDIGTLSGIDSVCEGVSSFISTTVAGGSWSSSNTGVMTVAGGIVTPVGIGTATISYSLTNACGTSFTTMTMAVVTAVVAGTISGPDTVCYGHTVTLTGSVPGGTWMTTSLYVTVGSTTGTVTGVAPGLAVIRHIIYNDCSTDTAYFPIYVKYSLDCPPPPTSIRTTAANTGIRLYPTPTTGNIMIESPVAGTAVVYTMDGKEVARYITITSGVSELRLPAGIAQGLYLCRFSGNDGSIAMLRIIYEP